MADLEELRAIVALADSGSVTRAAASLGTSRARLRRKLASLEERAQVQLLDRSGGVLTPTEPGASLVKGARRLLEEASLLISHTREIGSEPTGLLRVGLQPGFPHFLIAQTTEALEATYKNLRVETRIAENPITLLPEAADLAVVADYDVDVPQCVRMPIADLRCQLLATDEYLSGKSSPATPADLVNHRLLVWLSLSGSARHLHLSDGNRLHIQPALVSTSERFLRYLAAAHKGIAYVPNLPYPDPDFPGLRTVLAHQVGRPIAVHMYVPNVLKDLPRVKAILDVVGSMSTHRSG